MYYVYALYNIKADKIYIGQTNNLKTRLSLHWSGLFTKSYTAKNKGDWKLIYSEDATNRKSALKREKQLKSYQGRQFIRKFIPV